jgi:mRNA interferase RelE/StbE
MHKIILHRNAVKFYRKVNDTLKERVADAFDVIARNPNLDGHIKKLKGDLKHMHRFRMGDLRILYEIDDAQEIVRIKAIEWRGSAYK